MATRFGGERDASTTFARNATLAPTPETKLDVTGFPAKGTVLGYRYLGGLGSTNATMRYVKVADGNGGVTETLEDNPEYKTAKEIAVASGEYKKTLAENVALATSGGATEPTGSTGPTGTPISGEIIIGNLVDLSTKPKTAPPSGMHWAYGNNPNENYSSYSMKWVLQPDSMKGNGVTGEDGTSTGRQKSFEGKIYKEFYTTNGATKWVLFGEGYLDPSQKASTQVNTAGSTGSTSTIKTAEQLAAEALTASKNADRKSAYDLLFEQFSKYGLSSLVEPLKALITDPGVSPSEFTIKLRETEPYKQRFGANTQRIAKGLRSLTEAEYIGLEDQYQNVMRNYGLPDTYYAKGDLGRQPGFEKFIAGDVSPVELESRIQTAQNRVVKANPEVSAALKQFYPDISSGDILAYVLDPTNALENIKRKVSAAEIGGAALQQGLQTGVARAEQLASYGITKQMAEQGYGTIGAGLQRGSELASIYGQPAYNQRTAEQEVFNLAGGTEAARERKKLTSLERATFGGTTGITGGALSRERAGEI